MNKSDNSCMSSGLFIRTLCLALGLLTLPNCGPKVDTSSPIDFDDDSLDRQTNFDSPSEIEIERTRVGVVSRSTLSKVLVGGVGRFLTSIEVEPERIGNRFAGWRIIRFDNDWIDLIPGDTVNSVNGKRIERPDQVQALWDSLAKADEIIVVATREGAKFELRFSITGTQVP